MSVIKQLVSPFALVPSAPLGKKHIKQMPRPAPPCNCDSDEDNNFGMAPECAFYCDTHVRTPSLRHNKSKKRGNRANALAHAHARTKSKSKSQP